MNDPISALFARLSGDVPVEYHQMANIAQSLGIPFVQEDLVETMEIWVEETRIFVVLSNNGIEFHEQTILKRETIEVRIPYSPFEDSFEYHESFA